MKRLVIGQLFIIIHNESIDIVAGCASYYISESVGSHWMWGKKNATLSERQIHGIQRTYITVLIKGNGHTFMGGNPMQIGLVQEEVVGCVCVGGRGGWRGA